MLHWQQANISTQEMEEEVRLQLDKLLGSPANESAVIKPQSRVVNAQKYGHSHYNEDTRLVSDVGGLLLRALPPDRS